MPLDSTSTYVRAQLATQVARWQQAAATVSYDAARRTRGDTGFDIRLHALFVNAAGIAPGIVHVPPQKQGGAPPDYTRRPGDLSALAAMVPPGMELVRVTGAWQARRSRRIGDAFEAADINLAALRGILAHLGEALPGAVGLDTSGPR